MPRSPPRQGLPSNSVGEATAAVAKEMRIVFCSDGNANSFDISNDIADLTL